MTGILLINMGGAESLEELKKFLHRMFLDKHILPVPWLVRSLLARYISSTRYKKSWRRYEAIGGTPIKKSTVILAEILQQEMGENYKVKFAYSYSEPLIAQSIAGFARENIHKVIALPMYPHASITTTSSVIDDIKKAAKNFEGMRVRPIPEFFDNPHFVSFWALCISQHIREHKIREPFLIFSAHSLPLSCIKKGDTYQESIEISAKLIAQSLGFEYAISYQSQMNPRTWLGPDTSVTLKRLASIGKKEIIIVPFSFVSENLETLYDLDKVIIPEFKKETGTGISRIVIPEYDPLFIEMLKDLINDFNY